MLVPIVVGTSSWADPGFIAKWYPKEVPARGRLAWYAEHFDAVEVNSTYYAIPARSTVERWAQETPPGFTFDVKLHKLLSRHAATFDSLPRDLRERVQTNSRGRVLLEPELELAVIDSVLDSVGPLIERGKLSAFLLQLTPAFCPDKNDLDELAPLVERFAPLPVAIELRHRWWVTENRRESTLEWMRDHGAIWVSVDSPPGDHIPIMPQVDAVTRPGWGYLRAHGRDTEGYMHGKSVAERFGWQYSCPELMEIADRAKWLAAEAAQEGTEGSVRVMFNNNRDDDAPNAGLQMRKLLGQRPRMEPGAEQLSLLEEGDR